MRAQRVICAYCDEALRTQAAPLGAPDMVYVLEIHKGCRPKAVGKGRRVAKVGKHGG